jgi:hypothetical protein
MMAGLIRVDKIERSMGSKMVVKFDVRTSVAQLPIEMTVCVTNSDERPN